ncbi:MAG: NADH:flavin oxidoreductase [Proteobacteria bacterium]|nr:NADH:flavin oxidoreductase [Pseudomonadota bacterium]
MKIFQATQIGKMKVKNRIVMPAMQLALGLTNSRARAYYMERAKGGVGTIIMSGTSVDLFNENEAWGRADGVARLKKGMKAFTKDVHQQGVKIGIQLWHGNHIPAGAGIPTPDVKWVAPSAVDGMKQLTVKEIHSIIDKFARAAKNAKEFGLDFIQLHGAHGYLLCQFFSGADNQRTDKYGGNLGNRMRFGVELVEAVRKAVGPSFPISYRIGAEENRSGGVTLSQSKKFAVELEKAGVDFFDVSLGKNAKRSASPTKRANMGTFADLAAGIKSVVEVPVMAVGRINTGQVAESILAEGKADLVGVARQLIADPYWPKKVKQKKEDAIVACKSCNTCFTPIRGGQWRPGDQICKVNLQAGREADDRL